MISNPFLDLLSTCVREPDRPYERTTALLWEKPRLNPLQLACLLVREGVLRLDDANLILGLLSRDRPAPEDLTGRKLGEFMLVRPLGRSTYLAETGANAVKTVIRLLPPDDSAAKHQAFAREYGGLKHPNLQKILDLGADGGRPFLVMQYFEGEPLGEVELPSPPARGALLHRGMSRLAGALEELHGRGLAHRAIAPSRLILRPDGELGLVGVRIGDAWPDPLSADTAALPPEVIKGDVPESSSDLYSLGSSIYAALADRSPFEGATPVESLLARLDRNPPAEPLVKAGVPTPLRDILLRLLDQERAWRPNAGALADALEDCRGAFAQPPPLSRAESREPAPLVRKRPVVRPAAPAFPPGGSKRFAMTVAVLTLFIVFGIAGIVGLVVTRKKKDAPAPTRRIVAAPRPLSRAESREPPPPAEPVTSAPDGEAIAEAALERKDFDRLETLISTLRPEDALRACDNFLARWPKSRRSEHVLFRKRELHEFIARSRVEATPVPPPDPPPPPSVEKPVVKIPDVPASPVEKPAVAPTPPSAVPGEPGRAVHPSVRGALHWLARHQNPDGSWSTTHYTARCNAEPCLPNPGGEEIGAGVTALALSAFLAAGYGWKANDVYDGLNFGAVTRRGCDYLVRWKRAHSVPQASPFKAGYVHGLSTGVLAEAVRSLPAEEVGTISDGTSLRAALQDAVDYLVRIQTPSKGWRYSLGETDSSVTSQVVLALLSARRAGVKVPDATFKHALGWFAEVADTSGRVGYNARGTGKVYIPGKNEAFDANEVLTAAAALCLLEAKETSDLPRGAAEFLRRNKPRKGLEGMDFYYWYFGTRFIRAYGNPDLFDAWKSELAAAMPPQVPLQSPFCRRGSWEPLDRWSCEGGRVYATALNTLTHLYANEERLFDYRMRPPSPSPAAQEAARFLFHLRTGGQLRVVSYEDQGDAYAIKLPVGASRILKESVEKIVPIAAPK